MLYVFLQMLHNYALIKVVKFKWFSLFNDNYKTVLVFDISNIVFCWYGFSYQQSVG